MVRGPWGDGVSDWKQAHANEAEKALDTTLVKDVIREQLENLGREDDALAKYGLTKIAMYAASVARAQALGFDPELLRLNADEANDALLAKARLAVELGKPVWLIDETGATRLD